jgi:acetylornithine/succinyldiaminopimelate/putrescine aminotransferase
VEGALKLAKRFTGRSRIISFRKSYHGSTHGALSVQGSESFRNAFRPLLPECYQISFNRIDSLNIIDERTACVIIEPVQGEAGVIFPEEGFLENVRDKCTKSGSLLIFDEIQTGFGRLGKMFAIDRFKVIPDVLLLAKALGGGMPLGAFISSNEIMSSLSHTPRLGHISTFGGHPVSCAAGMASMKVLTDEKLTDSCGRKSSLFRKLIVHDLVREIRGEGLLLAVKLRASDYVKYVVAKAPEFGLVLDYFLFCDDSFRIAPPLTISEEEISWACEQIGRLLDDAVKNITLK